MNFRSSPPLITESVQGDIGIGICGESIAGDESEDMAHFAGPPKICFANETVRFFGLWLTESSKTLQSGSVFSALSIGAIYSSLTFFVFEL